MATFDLVSALSSPTLLLRLPASEKTYTVHRALLQHPSSNLLSTTKRRTTTLQLPPGVHQSSLERVLEYLYTRSYTPPSPTPPPAPTTQNTHAHPVVAAAAAGKIGVWAGPGPVFTKVRNLSSYTSVHIKGATNAYADPSNIPSSTTEFASYEPELKDQQKGSGTSDTPRVASPQERLHAHLEVYALSQRFAITGLPEKVLAAVAADVKARRELLGELVREVYGTKKKDEFLRGFVVGLVVTDWEAWRKEESVRKLLLEGGEFVVDLVSRVKGF